MIQEERPRFQSAQMFSTDCIRTNGNLYSIHHLYTRTLPLSLVSGKLLPTLHFSYEDGTSSNDYVTTRRTRVCASQPNVEETMIKRLILMFLTIGLFYCASSVPAHGQANCSAIWNCSWYSFNSGCIPTPPPSAYNCQYNGPWAQVCQYLTVFCAPAAAPSETGPCPGGCPTGGGAGGAGGGGAPTKASAGNPISLVTGNTFIVETDVRIPGLSSGLTLSRTWNSKWPPTQVYCSPLI